MRYHCRLRHSYSNRSDIVSHIDNLQYEDWQITNTAAGLRLAAEVFSNDDRPDSKKVAIVITDGYSSEKFRQETEKRAVALQQVNLN